MIQQGEQQSSVKTGGTPTAGVGYQASGIWYMRSVQGKGKAVSSGTRPRLLVLLLVDPGEPDVAHALLHLQPQMIQLRSHTWTENDVRQHGTTARLPSYPSCSPSRSIDRTQAPAERRDRPIPKPSENISGGHHEIGDSQIRNILTTAMVLSFSTPQPRKKL